MIEVILKFIAGAFLLIFVYLVAKNPQGVTSVLQGLGTFNSSWITALQGR